MDDLNFETAGSENMAELMKEKRKQHFRAMLGKLGKITQIKEEWDKRFVFVIYETPDEAQTAMQTLRSNEARIKLVKDIRYNLTKSGESTLHAPLPNFYVRWPKIKPKKPPEVTTSFTLIQNSILYYMFF